MGVREPLWRVHYRGQISGARGMEFVRAKDAREARKLFKADYPLRDVVTVGSKPVLPQAEPDESREG
jgi:hypothetical protein